jgi:hypothetical protein
MWLKIAIVVLFLGILATLGGAFYTLMKDQGNASKRTAHLLAVRVGLAALLVILVTWGVWSGNLGLSSPWYTP